jgi:hypothetical protein
MDLQTVFVVILFGAALFYIGRIIYRSIKPANNGGCATGCNKCGVDFSNINPDQNK